MRRMRRSFLSICRQLAQDWFKTGTGLGVTKARLAVPDEGSRSTPLRSPCERPFTMCSGPICNTAGVLDLVSPSFYPLQVPTQPSELKAADWSAAPANAYMVAYGYLTLNGTNLPFAGFLSDVRNPTAPLALQKIYLGAATDEGARNLAHQFADDIVACLERRAARHRADANRLCELENRATRKSGRWITTARTRTN